MGDGAVANKITRYDEVLVCCCCRCQSSSEHMEEIPGRAPNVAERQIKESILAKVH